MEKYLYNFMNIAKYLSLNVIERAKILVWHFLIIDSQKEKKNRYMCKNFHVLKAYFEFGVKDYLF